MNSVVKIFIVLWFSFLSAPTIISMVSEGDDITIAYNIAEEETNNETKHVEKTFTEFIIVFNSFSLLQKKHSKKINSEYQIKHDLIAEEIFIPPPELV